MYCKHGKSSDSKCKQNEKMKVTTIGMPLTSKKEFGREALSMGYRMIG